MSVASWDATLVQAYLQDHDFLVTAADDATTIFDSLTLLGRPVVILETDLPDMSWTACLKKLRRSYRNMTILVLNSKNSVMDQNQALALGADDVITPNMQGSEIAARIRAIMARRSGFSGPNVHVGPLQLRMQDRSAYWGGQKIELSPTQYNIFETICLASPYSVSKHVIMAELYGIEEGCEALSINVFISHIRARLVAAGAPRNAIETVHGRGYRLSKLEPGENVMPVSQFGAQPDMHNSVAA